MPGCLKPYFYFVLGRGAGTNPVQQGIESIQVIGDSEHICQDFSFRVEDEAVMLVLRDIDTNRNHSKTSNGRFVMLHPQNTLPCSLVPHKPSGGI